MKVLVIMNAIHNFISGETFFRSLLKIERPEYISLAKETLKFILIPAFDREGGKPGRQSLPPRNPQMNGL